MKITINRDEIEQALCKVIEKKFDYIIGEVNPEMCWFTVVGDGKDIGDLEIIEYTAEIERG